jgi:hypothetical protein
VAVVILLASAYFQFSGAIGTGGLTVVWTSIGLSGAAVATAAAAILLPGKRSSVERTASGRDAPPGTSAPADGTEADHPARPEPAGATSPPGDARTTEDERPSASDHPDR